MKVFMKRILTSILAAAMMISQLQLPYEAVYASEAAEYAEEEVSLAEETLTEEAVLTQETLTAEETLTEDEVFPNESAPEEKTEEYADTDDTLGMNDFVEESYVSEEESSVNAEEPKETEEAEETGSAVEDVNAAASELRWEQAELKGVYQFGGAPSGENSVDGAEAFAIEADARSGEVGSVSIEEYIYQELLKKNTEINIEGYNIPYGAEGERIGAIFSGVINEHPELYFVNKGFEFSRNASYVVALKPAYDNSLDDALFKREAEAALATVKDGMTDLQKAIALHDYLAVNCEYDTDNLDKNTVPGTSYTAYGVLVKRVAVCEGYALAYKYLLNQADIECLMVTSEAMNHAWNLIKLDGEYYQVDVTWDDPTRDMLGRAVHAYMFKSDDAFKNNADKPHDGWKVTSGSEVVDYKANDTKYDNAFWNDVNSLLVLAGDNWNDCYYAGFDKDEGKASIYKTELSGITQKGTGISGLGAWASADGGYWIGAYTGLFLYNDRLYYNDSTSIYSIKLDGTDKKTEYTLDADTRGGYIYGCALRDGNLWYVLHETPNLTEKETPLDSGVKIGKVNTSIPVESVALDKTALILEIGKTDTLTATVKPDNATDSTVTWTSDNNAIATVTDGKVTAVAVGKCTITAAAGDKSASCEVTVNTSIPVESVALDKTALTLEIGKTDTLTATVKPDNAADSTVTWTSDNNAIATVTDGKVTAVAVGKCTITAEAGGKSASCEVTVNASNALGDTSGEIRIDGFKKALIYTGQKVTQNIRVYYKETTLLRENVDYTLRYYNNVNATSDTAYASGNMPSLTITMKGQYSGIMTLPYTINPIDINTINVYKDKVQAIVPGTKPLPELTFGKLKLRNGKDFTCDYSTLKDSYYKVEGKGNFSGSFYIRATEIDKKNNFASAAVRLADNQYYYNGTALTKDVQVKEVKLNGKLLDSTLYKHDVVVNGADDACVMVYPTDAGEKAGYLGCKRVNLKVIGDRNIGGAVSGTAWKDSLVFSQKTVSEKGGIFQAEADLLKFGSDVLKEGEDYTVKYSNAARAGKVTVTFTGLGRYKGTLKKTYTIAPNTDKTKLTVDWKNVQNNGGKLTIPYQKGGAVPEPVVKDSDGIVLKNKTDYTVKLKDNKNPGQTMTCTIDGKGNYKGYSESFNINIDAKGDISKCTMLVPDMPYKDTLNAWKSRVTIIDANGKKLSAGTDYDEPVYKCNGKDIVQSPEAGSIIDVTAQGKGLYEGAEITGSYHIYSTNIRTLKVVIDPQYYTGDEIKLAKKDVHVSKDGTELNAYEIVEGSYKNNVNTGTARVTLRGTGAYGGEITCSFKIQKKAYKVGAIETVPPVKPKDPEPLANTVKKISLDRTSISIMFSEDMKQQTLTAEITPLISNKPLTVDTDIVWSTSDESIAEVKAGSTDSLKSTAVITPKGKGSATITVTERVSGEMVKCKIEIFDMTDKNYFIYEKKDVLTAYGEDITKCIEWAVRNKYDGVYIPAGEYNIDAEKKIELWHVNDGNKDKAEGEPRRTFEFKMDSGAVLRVIPNDKSDYSAIWIDGSYDVTVSGGKIVGERDKHLGKTGEGGEGISIYDSRNITIENVDISNFWGDGIYLGTNYNTEYTNKNIRIINCNVHDNRRNNLSITMGDGVTIDGCEFNRANGVNPQVGIDIEPNERNFCKNITILNSIFAENKAASIAVVEAVGSVEAIRVESCTLDGNLSIWKVRDSKSKITIKNITFKGSAKVVGGDVTRE